MNRPAQTSVRSVNYATSPLLASKTPPWRSRFAVALLALAFVALLGRAAYLQIIATAFYQAQGDKRFVHRIDLPASRGRILDRNGQVLASSVAMPSVQLDMHNFVADDAQRRALARLIAMPLSELDARIAAGGAGVVVLRREVEEPVWQQIRALGIKGMMTASEFERRYPEGEAAAHVVGFTNFDGQGQEGIELAYQKQLVGHDGARTVVRDRYGRIVEDIGDEAEPVDGGDVTLSIDSKIQFYAYQRIRDAVIQHRAHAGSIVVVDTHTGEVLALANYPSYDPSNRKHLSGGQLRNRALTDVFEPGSTMKPLIIGWALQTHRVGVDTMIRTQPGSLVVGRLTVRDDHGYPELPVWKVIQKSSNIGAARIALMMSPHELWDLFTSVGYGQRPQIHFPGAVTGRLKPWKTWRPIEQATMAYGYGISVSLLQLARAYTALARDGDVIPVTLLKQDHPAVGVKIYSSKTVREVRRMLQLAAGPGGTAPKAQTQGYSVGGKTGTAHKSEGRAGYAANKYRAWFVGMAPITAPRIIVAVMVDEPSDGNYYGADVAAPVFSQVVQQTLRIMNVPPDLDLNAPIKVDDAAGENF
ncbi:MAG: penicillin-binding protein 2 [Burkholderiales bacterium]|nr:penicillin-binding protein 2 [Burkholderiales bacterium]MDE2158582.1 penicillin-binding protein 2 [Burkholderiales bacterium]MDE2504532.1 penicillin-binding protein 2 [Burkholderiales bacterium]